jgi:hypothetical protein
VVSQFLELRDILINFFWLHDQLLQLDPGLTRALGILELSSKFKQEGVSECGDVLGV